MVHAEQREDDRQRHRRGHEMQDTQSAQHFSRSFTVGKNRGEGHPRQAHQQIVEPLQGEEDAVRVVPAGQHPAALNEPGIFRGHDPVAEVTGRTTVPGTPPPQEPTKYC